MDYNRLLNKLLKFFYLAVFILIPLILTPYNYELFEFNKIIALYFLTGLISGTWILKMIFNRKIIFNPTPFFIPLVLFLLSQIISTILSIDPHTSLFGYYSRFHGGLLSTISYLILFFAYSSNFSQKPEKTTLDFLKVILSTALLVSLYAVLERLGIDKHLWIQDVQNRVFSTLGQPNWLAAYLLALIPLTLAFIFKNRSKKIIIKINLFLLFIFYLTLLFTKSRSGLLGLTAAFAIFFALYIIKQIKKINYKKILIVFLIIFTTTLIIGTDYTPSLNTLINKTASSQSQNQSLESGNPESSSISLGGSKSSEIRKVVWQGSLKIFLHYPFFGSGVETFGYSYYNFRPVEHNLLSEWDFLYNKAHNEFLNFLSTTGIVGLLAYLSIIFCFTAWSLINYFKVKNSLFLPAFLAGFLGLSVSNFFGFSIVPTALFFFLFPVFSYSLTKKPEKKPLKIINKLSGVQLFLSTITITLTIYVLYQIMLLWIADFHFAESKKYLTQNEVLKAYNSLNQAVKLSPHEPVFRSEYSVVTANAAFLYHQTAVQPPENISEKQQIEISFQARQLRDAMINQAIKQSDIVLKKNPVHLNFYKNRARLFLTLSQIDGQYQTQAVDSLKKAVLLSPTDPKLTYNLSLLYHQINQTLLAVETLEKTIQLKPDYETARYALGLLYLEQNEADKARLQFEYILKHINPQNTLIQEQLQKL